MEIPELEDEGHEDITKMVADAPKVAPKRTHLLHKLDDQLGSNLGSTISGVDLSLLMACLCPQEEVSTACTFMESTCNIGSTQNCQDFLCLCHVLLAL